MSTILDHARAAQGILNNANHLLATTRQLARDIGLAPFRIAHITAAMNDNTHAWQELNELAASLTLDRQPPIMPPYNLSTPHET